MNIILFLKYSYCLCLEMTGRNLETVKAIWLAWRQYMQQDDLALVWERLVETGKILPGLPVIPGWPGQHYFADVKLKLKFCFDIQSITSLVPFSSQLQCVQNN
jgi:hypothetical protein